MPQHLYSPSSSDSDENEGCRGIHLLSSWRQFSGFHPCLVVPVLLCCIQQLCIGALLLWSYRVKSSIPLFNHSVDSSACILVVCGCAGAFAAFGSSILVSRSRALSKLRHQSKPTPGSELILDWLPKSVGPLIRWVTPVPLCYFFHWCCRLLFYPNVPYHDSIWSDEPWWMSATFTIGWISSAFIVSYLSLVFLGAPFVVSGSAIKNFIHRIETETAPDWNDLLAELHLLDALLEELWSVRGAGSSWMLAIGTALLVLLFGSLQLLSRIGHEGTGAGGEFAYASFFFSFGTIVTGSLLYALSIINTMCQSSLASANSIAAAARRYLVVTEGAREIPRKIAEEERQAHHRFMAFASTNGIGVRICGKLVTSSWLMSQAAQLGVVVPVVYQVLKRSASIEDKP